MSKYRRARPAPQVELLRFGPPMHEVVPFGPPRPWSAQVSLDPVGRVQKAVAIPVYPRRRFDYLLFRPRLSTIVVTDLFPEVLNQTSSPCRLDSQRGLAPATQRGCLGDRVQRFSHPRDSSEKNLGMTRLCDRTSRRNLRAPRRNPELVEQAGSLCHFSYTSRRSWWHRLPACESCHYFYRSSSARRARPRATEVNSLPTRILSAPKRCAKMRRTAGTND